MAITSTVIGNLGAGKVTEAPFTFDGTGDSASDIDSTWNIPAGRHLFFWRGVKRTTYSGTVTIDGVTFELNSGNTGNFLGGYLYVDGPKTIQATGTGVASFSSLEANWVKVAA